MSGAAPLFALLTDFGVCDPYVGQMKAVLLSAAPCVPIVDISHGVPPHAVATGAFFLAASRRFHPAGTIFICVVDPGVGSGRDLVCIQGAAHTLLGPDNGLLAFAYRDMRATESVRVHHIAFPENPASATFHGRDILAPAAALLANGASPKDLGPPVTRPLAAPPWAEPQIDARSIGCTALHVDRFGNAILNLPESAHASLAAPLFLETPTGRRVALSIADHYAALPPEQPGILRGSQGFCELACNGTSAAEFLGLSSGDACRLVRERS